MEASVPFKRDVDGGGPFLGKSKEGHSYFPSYYHFWSLGHT